MVADNKNEKNNLARIIKPFGVALSCIIVFGIIAYGAWQNHQRFKEAIIAQTQQQMLSTVRATASRVEDFLRKIHKELDASAEILQYQDVAQNGMIIPNNPELRDNYPFKIIFDLFDEKINILYLLDADGRVLDRIPYSSEKISATPLGTPGVEYVKEHKLPYVTNMLPLSKDNKSISIVHPIFNNDKFIGMLRAVSYIDTLYKNFIQPVKIGENGYIFLLDDIGTIYYHPKSNYIKKNIRSILKGKLAGNVDIRQNFVDTILSGSEGTSIFSFDELTKETSSYAWTHIAINPKATGTAHIRLKYDSDILKVSIEKRARIIAAELDKSIPRLKDFVDGDYIKDIMREFLVKYPDIVEISINGPRSLKDSTLIIKANSNKNSVGNEALADEMITLKNDKILSFMTKQEPDKEFAGMSVLEVCLPIHTSEEFWPIIAVQPISELAVPIDENARINFGFACILILLFSVTGTILYKTQKNKVLLEAEKNNLEKIAETAEALLESEAKIRALSDSARDAILMMDGNGRISYWNPAAERIFGYSKKDALGKELHSFLGPERFYKKYIRAFNKFQSTGSGDVVGKTLELTAIRNGGHEFPIELSLSALKHKNEWNAIGIVKDITERKLAEEERRRSYLNLVGVMVVAVKKDHKVSFINKKGCEILGYDYSEIIGRDWLEHFIPNNFIDEAKKNFNLLLDKNNESFVQSFESPIINKFGEERIIEWNNILLKDNDGKIIGTLSAGEDITDKKRAEEALRSSELKLKTIFDNATDAIFIHNLNGTIIEVNSVACKRLGYKRNELLKMTPVSFNPPGAENKVKENISQIIEKGFHVFESENVTADNVVIPVEVCSRVIEYDNQPAILSMSRDITERKEAEKEKRELWKQLLQSQKLESIGTLAGGMTHDFNNILTAIMGYSEIALGDLTEDHPAYYKIETVISSSEKASRLVQQLLAFSRKQVLEIRLADIRSTVERVSNMLTRIIGEDIRLTLNISDSVSLVMADEPQIEQVIMNLVVNARHAMPNGGKLTIDTKNVIISEYEAREISGASAGEYVLLRVEDTGRGIPPEILDRIFEPFFTTKEREQGTGLGLSTAIGIIEQHNGFITVNSEVGKGSIFCVYIPAVKGEMEVGTIEKKPEFKRGKATILAVDDDLVILGLVSDILKPLGYNIISAASGEEALEIHSKCNGDIDLLFTDVVMTGMNGWELAEKVRAKQPKIKIIFTSGYVGNTTVQQKIQDAKQHFLSKPISPRTLVEKIQEVLN